MNRLFYVVITLMLLLSNAYADDDQTNNKKTAIEPAVYIVGQKISSEYLHIHSKDVPNGIYVVVLKSGNAAETDSPVLNEFVKSLIAKRGFKLADKLEGSSIALLVDFGFDADSDAAEAQLSHPETVNDSIGEKAIVDATSATGYAAMTAGGFGANNVAMKAAGINGLLGSLAPASKIIAVNGTSLTNPKIKNGFFGGKKIGGDNVDLSGYAVYFVPAKKRGDFKPQMKGLIEFAMNKWLDNFMINDETLAAPIVDKTNVKDS